MLRLSPFSRNALLLLLLLICAVLLHVSSILRLQQQSSTSPFDLDTRSCPDVIYITSTSPTKNLKLDSEEGDYSEGSPVAENSRPPSSPGDASNPYYESWGSITHPNPTTARDLAHTSIVAHAPGWTLFRNIYMANGTFYILSSNRSFPEMRMMTSTGLIALNTPENIALREPTSQNMDYIVPEEARRRWGGGDRDRDGRGELMNRVWTVEGNTLFLNDPSQFLGHYYHFVAELFFGVWAFWHGVWTEPSTSPHIPYLSSGQGSQIPLFHRAIFAHSTADGWRDRPGFNAYFLRAAFPSLTVEVDQDWNDRISATSDSHPAAAEDPNQGRAWHFPLLLFADRSAAFRGGHCGSTQRTAAEALELMRRENKLVGERVGGWWDPIRGALWRFAGVPAEEGEKMEEVGFSADVDVDGEYDTPATKLPGPDKVVITYVSRQGGRRRKLVNSDHEGLVAALEDLVRAKGPTWELNVIRAETMTKDEQIKAAARTTILLGVHGNGLTHLIFMRPTRFSAVIEIFYPEGFAHDYQWTTGALGMAYYGVWNDRYFNHSTKPAPSYPEGFQEDYIPVDGPAVARLIESHIELRLGRAG